LVSAYGLVRFSRRALDWSAHWRISPSPASEFLDLPLRH
jgi:hypothetical protein